MHLPDLLAILRCPTCHEALTYRPVPQRDTEIGACGLLTCSCATYPVLDGIPILRRDRLDHRSIADDRVLMDGPTVADVVRHVENGSALDALVSLLAFPVCPWPLNRIGVFRRWSTRGPHRNAGLSYRRQRVRRMLARREALTAEDWLAMLYWHAPVPYDPFNYFFYKFGQPRHVASLALLETLPRVDRPLLDVGSGYGHLLHAVCASGRQAVGLDQNLHQAWVARHYVAPDAAFVCADANAPLPIADGAVSAVTCVDAFHYVRDKPALIGEMERCAGHGPLVLVGVGNAQVTADDGMALSPEAYAALFAGRPHRLVTERALVDRYLDGRGPDLSASASVTDLAVSPRLSIVSVRDPAGGAALLRDHGPLRGWPHARGALGPNPIYEPDGDALAFRFPSPWYRFENRAMRSYMPPRASLRDTPQDELIARFVLLGLPARYARERGRPWTVGANRVVSEAAARLSF